LIAIAILPRYSRPLSVATRHVLTLVVRALAARQRNFHLDFSLREVELQRNQREVTITYLADQSVDLAPVE